MRRTPRVKGSTKARAVVFDVGGTSFRAGLVQLGSTTIDVRLERPSPSFLTLPSASGAQLVEAFVDAVWDAVDSLEPASRAVAIGFPGPIDGRGAVRRAPTLWGERVTEPIDVAALVRERRPDVEVVVVNDVTAAGRRFAPRRGSVDVVTVGSGIGNKVFVDGAVVVGDAGRGGEIGHWRVDHAPDAPPCDCGGRGHLGALASGRALGVQLQRVAAREPTLFSRSALFASVARAEPHAPYIAALRANEPFATLVAEALAEPLGVALALMHAALGVDRHVLVGGFARAQGEVYRRAVAAAAARSVWSDGTDWDTLVELGPDDDDSGLIGLSLLLGGEFARER